MTIKNITPEVATKLLGEKSWLSKIEKDPFSIGASRGSNAPAHNLRALLEAIRDGRPTVRVYMTYANLGMNHYAEVPVEDCLQNLNEVPSRVDASSSGGIFRGFYHDAYNELRDNVTALATGVPQHLTESDIIKSFYPEVETLNVGTDEYVENNHFVIFNKREDATKESTKLKDQFDIKGATGNPKLVVVRDKDGNFHYPNKMDAVKQARYDKPQVGDTFVLILTDQNVMTLKQKQAAIAKEEAAREKTHLQKLKAKKGEELQHLYI